ncbi:hypothetical protein DP117_00045 [Brasilonema sp. UFV-L1]|nr:hypothetical protein [Brasilonema sp. UFV-L1]
MFQLFPSLIQALQPVVAPFCFVTICALIFLLLRSIWMSTRIGIANLKRLHQIKCADCRFFTNDFRLKCTVHPTYALTEEAINCSDFCLKNKHLQKLTSSVS